jgi:hypothetical protein
MVAFANIAASRQWIREAGGTLKHVKA